MKKLYIDINNSAPAALLAENEIKKYISAMDSDVRFLYGKGGLSLEVRPGLASVLNPDLDDAAEISVQNGAGHIAGNNPRALLIACYMFLNKLGARFLKPGPNGEIIPSVALNDMTVSYRHAASYRHRGICIEGAVGIEHVLDLLEWMPKVGFNAYFVQFLLPVCFFQRYYGREQNPYKEPERLTRPIMEGFMRKIENSARQRGIVYHTAGHGWTCEPLGVPGPGWYVDETKYPAETAQYFAMVDGRRELSKKIALNTNLCYSNPDARAIVTDAITDYCADNPAVDVVQFWLADGVNNHCECDGCKDTRPADYYVRMLNELDVKMTTKNIQTRVVFLIYCDLLWKPEHTELINKDRFILMFAPISRTYSQSIKDEKASDGAILAYNRNKLVYPRTVSDTLAYLNEWQEAVPGCDSFLFDYHFMWDYIMEPGGMAHAETLFDDMANLGKIHLNGMISCQNQRTFFPSPLGMLAMAAALWDKNTDYGALKNEIFDDCFDSGAETVKQYLTELSGIYPADILRRESPHTGVAAAARFEKAALLCERSRPALVEAAQKGDPCVEGNYRVLMFHNELTQLNARMFAAYAKDDEKTVKKYAEELAKAASDGEDENETEFDLALYLQTLYGLAGMRTIYPMPRLDD